MKKVQAWWQQLTPGHKKRWIWGSLAILSIIVLVVSINRSKKLPVESDYYVFWFAGENFFSGQDLYAERPGIRNYYYPPFAAQLFQLLRLLPFKVSAFLFWQLNFFVLLPLALGLLWRMAQQYGLTAKQANWAVFLATVGSFKYIWNNLINFQMNYVVFIIMLLGIWWLMRGSPARAGVLFVLATFLKVIPVLFIGYTLLRHRTLKVWATVALATFVGLALPIFQRGWQTGLQDYNTYLTSFLKIYQEGAVITSHTNHTAKAFIIKILAPERWNSTVYHSEFPEVLTAVNWFLLILLIVLATAFIYHARRASWLSWLLLSCLFIFSHLISGITWTAHLVTAHFWLMPLFIYAYRRWHSTWPVGYWLFIGLILVLGIEGKDISGEKIYQLIRYYDVFVALPLVLLVGYLYFSLTKQEPAPKPENYLENNNGQRAG